MTTKSSIKVARAALRVASRTLPRYANPFSPKKFTQPQLFACLVLKTLWKVDFRTAELRLHESDMPPTVGRKTDNPPRGKYRRQMKENLDRVNYGQRWQVETVFSMIKRNLGYTLSGRSQNTQNAQILLMAITHHLMIYLLVKELLYRAPISK